MFFVDESLQLDANIEDILFLLKSRSAKSDLFSKAMRRGDEFRCCCPFHKDGKEKKPSFSINLKTGQYNCFTCLSHGNIVTLTKHILELKSYENARDWLKSNFGASLLVDNKVPFINFKEQFKNKKQEVKEKPKSEIVYVSEEELKTYRFYHPYMFKRGLTRDIINKFDVGLDQKFDKGMAITFPVRDIEGRTLFIARRCVNNKIFHYPNGAEKPLYGIYELSLYYPDAKQIWVCESIIDCLRLWCNDIPAIALNGVGSQYQYNQLKKLGATTLVLATDNDEAGQKARRNIKYAVKGVFFLNAHIPKNRKDIGECTDEEIKAIKVSPI